MRLAPEGRPLVGWGAGLTLLAGVLAWLLGGSSGALGSGLLLTTVGLAILTAFTSFFFRDPRRTVTRDVGAVLSPADGRVVQIAPVEEPTFLGRGANRISIFLSIFDVHIQRSPLSGTVSHLSRRSGSFGVAWSSEASEANEQASLGIDAGGERILVRQIAGMVARRIVTHPREGDAVERGERIGLIRFGSRVDLFLPPDWRVLCHEGDRVRAGLSVLARRVATGETES